MDTTFDTIVYLGTAGFIAAFIDAVVGGGGLISLPSLLFFGLPPTIALGTNKFASSLASFTSTVSFILSGKTDRELVKRLFPLSFTGSILGAYVVTQIPPHFLKPLVIVLLIGVAIYTVFKKDWGKQSTYKGMRARTALLSAFAAGFLGFYDGFFGPGAGSFLLFSFLLLGFDFVTAAGNARVLNFASNIAALLAFLYFGLVNYAYGIFMGIGMIFGAILGTQVAIRQGVSYVRPLFISVTLLLVGKQVWDSLH